MKKLSRIFAVLALTLSVIAFAVSCSGGADYGGGAAVGDDAYTGSGSLNGAYGDKVEDTGSALVENRKIIKNVNETVQTDRYDEFIASLYEAVNNAGGYVSDKNERGESYYNEDSLRYASFTVRIPAQALSDFTARVDSLAVVTYYSESQNDVTGAYIDTESRIAVLEAEESALLDMLALATSVDSALSIRTRLVEVQSDLASLRRQLESYDDRVAYSTVYLTVSEVRRAVEREQSFFEEVGGNFKDSLYGIGKGLRAFAVWLLGDFLYILLFLAVATAVFFLLRFVYRRFRASGKGEERIKLNMTKEK